MSRYEVDLVEPTTDFAVESWALEPRRLDWTALTSIGIGLLLFGLVAVMVVNVVRASADEVRPGGSSHYLAPVVQRGVVPGVVLDPGEVVLADEVPLGTSNAWEQGAPAGSAPGADEIAKTAEGAVPGAATSSPPTTAPQVSDAESASVGGLVPAPEWLVRVSASTGIPERALFAYAAADLAVDAELPSCGIGWNTLAGIGHIESGHGSFGGARLRPDGYASPAIRGPALDGNGFASIPDSDAGAWDGDMQWDRAVGPMQFIPGTWARWGADGDGDGKADPNQIDDAALAAARYLCASGSMASPGGWRTAVLSYNHSNAYVNNVAAAANEYVRRSQA